MWYAGETPASQNPHACKSLAPGNWLNDIIMEDYASLLASECDNTQTQILLVPPTVVAFIASGSISKSDAGMIRIQSWKRGVTKNKVLYP